MMEQMYAKHRWLISSLASVYAKDGIRMLLLKGYGCSLCYKKPEHRPTGDIDVYLFGKQNEADDLIEKKLGISGKEQIEDYGVENFVKECKESVFKYVHIWEEMTNKVGFWVDMKNPYITYDNKYIESVWWA